LPSKQNKSVHAALLQRVLALQTQPDTNAAGKSGSGDLKALVEALTNEKKKKEKPKLEVASRLASLTLARLDHEQWPLQKEADELLELVEKQKTRQVELPCPYVDLRKFAPAWCTALSDQREDSDSEPNEPNEAAKNLSKALGVRVAKDKRHLTVVQWMAAYDRYSVAAAVAGCYQYDTLLKHKDNVMRLAEECRTKGKPTALALVYDELARRDCDNKQYSGLPGHEPNKALKKLDRELVERAETTLDATRRNNYDKGSGKSSYDKGNGKGSQDKGSYAKGHDKGKGKGKGKSDDREKRKMPWQKEYWADKDENAAKHSKKW
jgi:hypothetical protein